MKVRLIENKFLFNATVYFIFNNTDDEINANIIQCEENMDRSKGEDQEEASDTITISQGSIDTEGNILYSTFS